MTANPTLAAPAIERRARLAWQIWLDGEVVHGPLALADGCVVVVDRAPGCEVVRLDADGERVWALELAQTRVGPAVRSEGLIAVPSEGGVAVLGLDGALLRVIDLPGRLVGPVAGLGGRLWARLEALADGGVRRLVSAPLDGNAPPILREDPLGEAGPVRWRRTNQTICAAAVGVGEGLVLAGLDERTAAPLWERRIEAAGLSDLWAAGGLLDVASEDGVRSFDARTGTPLTTRFVGLPLANARIAGETLITTQAANHGGLRVNAYECAFEVLRGALTGARRVFGAGSDLLALEPPGAPLALFELPELHRLTLREADALADPRALTFARSRVWVVGHGGRSLSALDV